VSNLLFQHASFDLHNLISDSVSRDFCWSVRHLTAELDETDAVLAIDRIWFGKSFTLHIAFWFLMNIGLSFHL